MNGISFLKNKIIGAIVIIEKNKGISEIKFLKDSKDLSEYQNIKESFLTKKCKKQLEEYFLGKRKIFNIELDINGTDFQVLVWKKILEIPYGQTISYSDEAKLIGNEKAVRAVGTTNGKNKLPILIPCHRVISKNGSLGGYSAGIDIKKYLLNLEKINS